jgi:hypothetical protein
LTPKTPWEQRSGESGPSFARFQEYLRQGADRSLASVARWAGVSRAAIHESSQRWDWVSRAKAFDAENALADPLPLAQVLAPVTPRADDDLDTELLEALEMYRAEVQQAGQSHLRLARGLSVAAARNAARLAGSDRLTARDVAALASVSTQLAASGMALWGRAIGAEQLISRMEAAREFT